jgi:hypothetical protein
LVSLGHESDFDAARKSAIEKSGIANPEYFTLSKIIRCVWTLT